MFYKENYTLEASKTALVEWRGRITEDQKRQLTELETKLNIPQAALIRMALDCFLPKLNNYGYSEKGIKSGYLNGKY